MQLDFGRDRSGRTADRVVLDPGPSAMLNERSDKGRRRRNRSGPGSAADAGRVEATAEGTQFLPPMKPNRRLLVAVAVVLGVWVGVLLTMYFTTVGPRAKPAAASAPGVEAGK